MPDDKKITLQRMLILIAFIVLMMVTYLPWLSLWLPNLMGL